MNRLHPFSALALGCATIAFPVGAASPTSTLTLATSPLANSSTTVVKPNIMFTMDDSGSMDYDYLPDWANSNTRRLFRNADYNGVFYNPAQVYVKPVFYAADGTLDTTTYPSQTGTSTATGGDSNATAASPNWKAVKNDAYGVQASGTTNLTYNANYYTFIPGEYCTTSTLTSCANATSSTTARPYAALLRWCNDSGLSNCRSLRNGDSGSYNIARYPAMGTWTATIVINNTANGNTVSSIVIDGREILSATVTAGASTTNSNLADAIVTNINNCTSTLSGNCTIYGYSASRSSSTITITAPHAGYAISPVVTKTGAVTASVTAFTTGSTTPGNIAYVAILPGYTYNYPGTNAKHPLRTDCVSTTCTYEEEMTNYANWYTYYHTRMQSMKTSVSRAFKVLDQGYRVGYNVIGYEGLTDTTKFRYPATFETTHKHNWYTTLFGTTTPSWTPLRAAVSKIGRFYAKKISNQDDPVQYSCQQNFHILSTDGYWNDNGEDSNYGPKKLNNSDNVGNQDGGTTPLPYKEGSSSDNTLADVAMYYYNTDLRTSALSNCTGAPIPPSNTTNDVCQNNVFVSDSDPNTQQHVTQFTMGMGIDGTLNFQNNYATATSGDYYDLKNGLNGKSWPSPISNTNEARIDDLWHAAVNGRGTYFSAQDPDSIVRGFTAALTAIKAKSGAGAAAATSTLNPVPGDNFAYVASYTTVKWQGNLEARTINTTTGVVSENASWCAEDVLADVCTSPGTITPTSTTSGTVYNCVTASVAAATCTSQGGTPQANGSCAVPMAVSCTGTMAAKVAASSDTRTIYMANTAGTALVDFNYTNIDARDLESYFAAAYLNGKLSQWTDLTTPQKTQAEGANLVAFLRGQTGYEDTSVNADAGRSTLYRYRAATLGDITESQPVFVGKPVFGYTDDGYRDFVTAKTNRAKTIFVGSNSGMLHAFNASNGQERWAFVPSAVIPNLWALADKTYSSKHTNYVNGQPVIADIFDPSTSADCAASSPANPDLCWKTILVAGLNGGGRGYYALDITDPAAPRLLWELSSANIPNLGYSYGPPIVTKNSAGTWVVVLTSGYNNVSPGDGQGYLFVRNAKTGAAIRTIATNVGDTTVPSGLAKVSNFADQGNANNTSQQLYGGDLMGNVWRFDINAASTTAMKFAILKATGNTTQPITAAPELGVYNNKRMIFIGTGKYLETTDLSDTQEQTIYAIKDDNETVTFDNPRTSNLMVEQFISSVTGGRTSTRNPVDIFTKRGWFIDFPDSGERVHVDPKLDSGALFVPTTVPSNTACSPGGYGWFNYFDYRNGWPLSDVTGGLVSQRFNAPIVGFNIYYLPSGQRIIGVVTADSPTPTIPPNTGDPRAGNTFGGLRIMWRELLTP